MAKIGDGTNNESNVDQNDVAGGQIDYIALYNRLDVEKTTRVSRTTVTAGQIREVIDGLFEGGMDEIAVATVRDMVDAIYHLEKTDDADTRIQNSSVRSAGTSGKKYVIVNIGTSAYFQKNPDYDPNAVKGKKATSA